MTRTKAVAGGIGVLSAMLVAGTVFAPVAGATETTGTEGNSAYAFSASGLLKVNPTPMVDDSNGFSQQSLAELKFPLAGPPLLKAKALNAQAGADRARASVADLSVRLGVGKPLLTATAVLAKCGNGKATSSLAKAKLGDTKLDVAVPPNTEVKVSGLLSVVLNKQTTNKDGAITVTAIAIDVDGIQKLNVASATCAENGGGDGGDGGKETPGSEQPNKPSTPGNDGGSSPAGDKALPNGNAPSPTPVKAHLDVTG